jgi:hypothetical protein
LIVSISHGFAFIHVPKSGGTSIHAYLERFTTPTDVDIGRSAGLNELSRRYADDHGLRKHSTLTELEEVLGPERLDGLTTFGFVRDPYQRTASLHRFLRDRWRNWDGSDVMDELATLESFVESSLFTSSGPGGILDPQTRWLCRDREIAVDIVGRTEHLGADLRRVCEAVGLPKPRRLRRLNRTGRQRFFHAPTGLSGSVRAAIEHRYAEDFDVFGYARTR